MKLTKFIPLLNVSMIAIPLVTSCSQALKPELEIDWERDIYNEGYVRQTGISQLTWMRSNQSTIIYLDEVKKNHLIFLDDYVIGTTKIFNEEKSQRINFDKTIGYSILDAYPTEQTISIRCDINGNIVLTPIQLKDIKIEWLITTPFSVTLENIPIEVVWVEDQQKWYLYVDVESLADNYTWRVSFNRTSLSMKGHEYFKDIKFAFDTTISLPEVIDNNTKQNVWCDMIELIFGSLWYFPIDYFKNVGLY